MFFSSFEVYGDFSFRGVYDLDTMEELTIESEKKNSYTRYAYDPNSGYLVLSGNIPDSFGWTESFEHFGAGMVTILKKNEDGSFSKMGVIEPEEYEVELPSTGNVLNKDILLLEGKDRTVIYDLKTLDKIIALNVDGIRLLDDRLIDTEILEIEDCLEIGMKKPFSELLVQSREMLTSSRGYRKLNHAEMRKYAIDEMLLEEYPLD